MNGSETSPLMSSSPRPYYFLSTEESKSNANEVGFRLSQGTTQEEFARPVMGRGERARKKQSRRKGFFSMIFGRRRGRGISGKQRTQLMKERQAAIKVEPKVFFANERTFLAWLHTSMLLAGASIAITSFSGDNLLDQLYGIVLLPVAIAFLCYAMYQYGSRSKLIRTTSPGPYEDIIGPSVLAVILICSIIAQFSIKLYSMF
mmetsp:Transcript_14558/g.17710  ORF Transcript_14558/g.17710 Transcript_14558/m.17710 type:complete len:203 (-) Transcript_14558:217-825(-)